MLTREVKINLKTGLQARPAALFVQEAARFSSDVFIEKDNKQVNAKSIMGIMSLAIGRGVTVKLIVDGKDEEEAMEKLVEFLEKEE